MAIACPGKLRVQAVSAAQPLPQFVPDASDLAFAKLHRMSELLLVPAWSVAPAVVEQNPRIEYGINSDNQPSQPQLDISGQPGRVKQRNDVLLHEAVRVPFLAGIDPEKVFQRRERANPARQLDEGAPGRRRNMDPDKPPVAAYQYRPRNDQYYEREVRHEDKVCRYSVEHRSAAAIHASMAKRLIS